MEKKTFYDLFQYIFNINKLEKYAKKDIIGQFYDMTNLMLEKNDVMNITAIRSVEKIIPLHYADCVSVASLFPKGSTVVDVGCGGGFPTLPLAIVRPDLKITGIDSTEKKVRYVQKTADTLKLDNVITIFGRAENMTNTSFREMYDVVTSRAVARLNILIELCLPFIKVGGRAVIMKGSAGQNELNEATKGIAFLGGEVRRLIWNDLWLSDTQKEKRTVIVIEKVAPTPASYPRQFGSIKNRPL